MNYASDGLIVMVTRASEPYDMVDQDSTINQNN